MGQLAGDHVQVLVDGYELTGDTNNISIADKRDMYDVTTFGDAVHKFIPGKRSVSFDHAGFMEIAAARSHPILKGIAIDGVVSVLLGNNAAPAVGDLMYSLSVLQGKYGVSPANGAAVPFSAMFSNVGASGGWGTALAVGATFTNTANGSSVDNGAASTQGGAAFLHVLQAAASDTYTIIVEQSSTGAFSGEQTTLATFTLNASALDSERIAFSGTVQRYTRWKATRTGSAGNTVKISLNLVRF